MYGDGAGKVVSGMKEELMAEWLERWTVGGRSVPQNQQISYFLHASVDEEEQEREL